MRKATIVLFLALLGLVFGDYALDTLWKTPLDVDSLWIVEHLPDGRQLLLAVGEGVLYVISCDDGSVLWTLDIDGDIRYGLCDYNHNGTVDFWEWYEAPSGSMVVSITGLEDSFSARIELDSSREDLWVVSTDSFEGIVSFNIGAMEETGGEFALINFSGDTIASGIFCPESAEARWMGSVKLDTIGEVNYLGTYGDTVGFTFRATGTPNDGYVSAIFVFLLYGAEPEFTTIQYAEEHNSDYTKRHIASLKVNYDEDFSMSIWYKDSVLEDEYYSYVWDFYSYRVFIWANGNHSLRFFPAAPPGKYIPGDNKVFIYNRSYSTPFGEITSAFVDTAFLFAGAIPTSKLKYSLSDSLDALIQLGNDTIRALKLVEVPIGPEDILQPDWNVLWLREFDKKIATVKRVPGDKLIDVQFEDASHYFVNYNGEVVDSFLSAEYPIGFVQGDDDPELEYFFTTSGETVYYVDPPETQTIVTNLPDVSFFRVSLIWTPDSIQLPCALVGRGYYTTEYDGDRDTYIMEEFSISKSFIVLSNGGVVPLDTEWIPVAIVSDESRVSKLIRWKRYTFYEDEYNRWTDEDYYYYREDITFKLSAVNGTLDSTLHQATTQHHSPRSYLGSPHLLGEPYWDGNSNSIKVAFRGNIAFMWYNSDILPLYGLIGNVYYGNFFPGFEKVYIYPETSILPPTSWISEASPTNYTTLIHGTPVIGTQVNLAPGKDAIVGAVPRMENILVMLSGNPTLFHIYRGWHLMSLPVQEPVALTDLLGEPYARAFFWDNNAKTYYPADTIASGEPFVLFSTKDTILNLQFPLDADTVEYVLYPGWNLIGAPNASVPARDAICDPAIFPQIYTFDPITKTYYAADRIDPYHAYWIFATDTTTIRIPPR